MALDAGTFHTCGLTADGAPYGWGDNSLGQVGDSAIGSSTAPPPVQGGHTFTAVSAGWQHTCGIATDASGSCWGAAFYGQLGNGQDTRPGEELPQPHRVLGFP